MAVEQQSGSTRLTARRGHDRPGSGSNPQLVPAIIRPSSPAKRPVADSTRMRSQPFGARFQPLKCSLPEQFLRPGPDARSPGWELGRAGQQGRPRC